MTTYDKVCARCGKAFVAKGIKALYCDDCKYQHHLEATRARRAKYRAENRSPVPRRKNGVDCGNHTVDSLDRIKKCLNCKRGDCPGDCDEMKK